MKKILLSVALLCSFGTVALLQADKCSSSKSCCLKKDSCCSKKTKKSCCNDKRSKKMADVKAVKAKKKPKIKTMSDVIEEEKSTAMKNDRVESE